MIEDTGERVIPKKMSPMNNLLLEHIARYQFALPYLEGRVLDMACGAGYGTHMIAKQRKKFIDEVIGIDIESRNYRLCKKGVLPSEVIVRYLQCYRINAAKQAWHI